MHVFVTGATGWVGSALIDDLLAAGHRVTGLARSADKAAPLTAKGARILAGSLDDLELLRMTASAVDAVVHTAFNHDWARFAESAAQDERAIMALGDALAGSNKPLLVTSGLSDIVSGRLVTEDDLPNPSSMRRSEAAAQALAERGVKAATIRLAPSVHGVGETHGFIPILINLARKTGVSAYLGKGENRWAGVYRRDAARLFRQVLESGAGAPVFHAVADEGVPFRQIAEVIGVQLGVPVEARESEHFGGFARMVSGDMAATSAKTRAAIGWAPTGASLLTDLADPGYYAQ
jgi:nucleoside-diphosphate-sugar epimerase